MFAARVRSVGGIHQRIPAGCRFPAFFGLLTNVPSLPAPLRLSASESVAVVPTQVSGLLTQYVVAPAGGGLLEIFEGEQRLFEIGVNFLDEAESDLRAASTGVGGAFVRTDSTARGESGAWSDPLFWILLAIATSAILVNWCVPAMERRIA